MVSRIAAIMIKEFFHILRDPRSLAIIFLLPIIMILLFGYAITFDIREIPLGLLDHDRSTESRALAQSFAASGYFRIVKILSNPSEIETAIRRREIWAALVIPADFEKSRQTHAVQVVIDGSNANTAIIIGNTAQALLLDYSLTRLQTPMNPLFRIEPRILYNPALKSTNFIVPGLVAVFLLMVCALLTSITIAREKETGTLEQILVSPITALEIIIGKTTPYIILGFLVAVAVLIFAKVVFSVPFRGKPLELMVLSLFYIYASLSIGVFVSTRVRTQQVALMVSLVGTLLPSIFLSGFIYPIASMPHFLRILSLVVPARYYLQIIRGIMLKGIGFNELVWYAAVLFLFGSVLLGISIKSFQTKLEG
ncbi:ABC transporter permease [candidate division KSB1 bacterium]|nr:ABC transporter permease [candidate division KSB1 bacterium]